MLPPTVMSDLPSRVYDRPLANLDNAVASSEPNLLSGLNKLYVRPLVPVIMNVVGNLGEEDPLISQDPKSFANKPRIGVSKGVTVLFRRTGTEAEARLKVF